LVSQKLNCILGAGQVGEVLENLLENTKVYDIGQWEGEVHIECDYLHIAIPFTDSFMRTVENAERIFTPDIMIIHSTVSPGTSKKLSCLYSPIMGRHDDDFKNNVKMYRKFIAGDKGQFDTIKSEFKLEAEYWGDNTNELEYSKVMSTNRMYWDLILQKHMQDDCKTHGYDFTQVYTRWTDNYNAGIRVKHDNWARPIYSKMETDKPQGHCLGANIHLLDNEVTNYIKAWEKGILYTVIKEY